MQKLRGFTLIELMVVLAISAILLTIGVPSFKSITYSTRVTSEINGLLGDMQFARSEALKQGQSVTACVSTDKTSCSTSTGWGSGWIIFTDLNNDGIRTTAEPLLRTQATLPTNDIITAKTGTTNVYYLTYNRMGFLRNNSAITADVKMKINPQNETNIDWTRCLVASQIGSMKVIRGACP